MVLWVPWLPSLGLAMKGRQAGVPTVPQIPLLCWLLFLNSCLFALQSSVQVMRTEHTLFTVIEGFAIEIDNPSWERHAMLPSPDTQSQLLAP